MIVENPYQYYREYYRIEDSKVEVRQLFMSLSYMFFYKHIFFGDQARICLVKIWKEAQNMLVICLF